MDLSHYKPGFVLFAAPYDEETVQLAKIYIEEQQIEKEKIKIVKRKCLEKNKQSLDMVCVIVL